MRGGRGRSKGGRSLGWDLLRGGGDHRRCRGGNGLQGGPVAQVDLLCKETGGRRDLVVDGDGFIDLDHQGVVHPDDSDKVQVAVGQVDSVDLKLFLLAIKENVHDEVTLRQLASDERLPLGVGDVGADVEDESVFLSGPDEHGDVNAGAVGEGVGNVNDGQAGGGVFVAEGGSCVVELTGRSKEGPVTSALELAPQVSAVSFVLARIGVALLLSGTARYCSNLINASIAISTFKVLFGDLHVIDSDILDASGEGGHIIGQDLLITDNAAQEGIEEDGVVLTSGVDGLRSLQLIIDTEGQVGRVHGYVDLVPLGVVQVLSQEDAFKPADQV